MVGEKIGPGEHDKLLKTINAQAPKIMEQYKAKGVDFSVVVKDNQVIIRAKPKTVDCACRRARVSLHRRLRRQLPARAGDLSLPELRRPARGRARSRGAARSARPTSGSSCSPSAGARVDEPWGSGVWGKHEWVAPQLRAEHIVSMAEGGTHLTRVPRYARGARARRRPRQAVRHVALGLVQGPRHDGARLDGQADDRATVSRSARSRARRRATRRRRSRRTRPPPGSARS